jgi:hypothetical protein
MCSVVCDGSCTAASSSSGAGEGLGALVDIAALVLVYTIHKGVVPAAAWTAKQVARWTAGAPLTPAGARYRRASGATWRRAGVKLGTTRLGLHWYAWPGWERAVARVVLVAVLLGVVFVPMAIVVVLAVLAAALLAAVAGRVRRRRADRQLVARVACAVGAAAVPQAAIAAAPASRVTTLRTQLKSVLNIKQKAGA